MMNKIRHGSPYDRGSADKYYRRPFEPHYFKGASYNSEMVEEKNMTPEEIAEYTKGYDEQVDLKDWG